MTPSNCETAFRFLIVYTPPRAALQQRKLNQALTSESLQITDAAIKINIAEKSSDFRGGKLFLEIKEQYSLVKFR